MSSTGVRPIVCCWDASSNLPGPAANAKAWRSVLESVPGLGRPIVLNRRLGDVIPTALTACVASVYARGERPLVLGGDHRLTYSVLLAATHRHGRLRVHQFDAHHDAHPASTINNYSFAHFASQRLDVEFERHGCRETQTRLPSSDAGTARSAYLTVDIDYLDPQTFSSVNFPLPAGDDVVDAGTLVAELDRAAAERTVVGADLVEWCAERATPAETELVTDVVARLAALLS